MKIQLPLAILILISLSCHVSSQKTANLTQSRDTSISVNNSYSELFFDSLQLENFIALQNIKDSLAAAMRNFYNQRNYQYAWFFKEGMADYATTFMSQQEEYMNYSRDSSIYNAALETTLDSLSDTIFIKSVYWQKRHKYKRPWMVYSTQKNQPCCFTGFFATKSREKFFTV
jgi:L,D-transpeptidase YcbB